MLLNFLRNLPFAEGASLPRPLIYVAMGSQFYSPSSHVPEALSVSSRGGESQGLQDPKRASSLSLSGLTFFLFYELYLPCRTSVSEVEGFRLRALPLCHCGRIWLQTCISQLGPSGGPSPGSVCHIFCSRGVFIKCPSVVAGVCELSSGNQGALSAAAVCPCDLCWPSSPGALMASI